MAHFQIDPRIDADTLELYAMPLTQLRLMNDRRFPWIVMIPTLPDITEINELSPSEQMQLIGEISNVSTVLKSVTSCDKINIAAFGNMVPQLHIHVVARFKADMAWPGSAIGFGGREEYPALDADALMERICEALEQQRSPD